MARSIHELASRPASAGGMRFERLSAESQRRWQQRGAQLTQFREQRTQIERQAASERRAAIAQGRGAVAVRPRGQSLSASPVGAPAHQRVASGSSAGVSGHTARGEAGAPLVHRDLESADRPVRVGQAAPHDVGREPLTRSEAPAVGHEATSRSDAPRLHAPLQSTRRQPPTSRTQPRTESRDGYRNP